MPIPRVKTWTAGDTLTANDLNNEFNNLANTALLEPFVASQPIDLNGQLLILDADGDTLIDAAVDDVVDFTIAGADDFRLSANELRALPSSNIVVEQGALRNDDGTTTLTDIDIRTDTVTAPLVVSAPTTSGPVSGIGTGILLKTTTLTSSTENVGQLEAVASVVTAGAETTYFQLLLRIAGQALTACYRFAATTAFKGIFTHSNSADRTYTLPDESGTVHTSGGAILIGAVAPSTPVANTLYSDSFIKGWVKFSVNGTIDDDMNVSSVTDNGPGDWTVSWATAFANSSYVAMVSLQTWHTIDTQLRVGSTDPDVPPTTTNCAILSLTLDAGTQTKSDPVGLAPRINVLAIGNQ